LLKKVLYKILILALLFFFFGCSSIIIDKELPNDYDIVSLNFGGPLTQVGGSFIPLPMSSITYLKGSNKGTYGGSLYLTDIIFSIFHFDLLYYKTIDLPKNFYFTLNPIFIFSTSFDSLDLIRLYPTTNFIISKKVSENKRIYSGINLFYDLYDKPIIEKESKLYTSLFLGYMFETKKHTFSIELKYLGLDHISNRIFYSPLDNGGLGLYFAWGIKWDCF